MYNVTFSIYVGNQLLQKKNRWTYIARLIECLELIELIGSPIGRLINQPLSVRMEIRRIDSWIVIHNHNKERVLSPWVCVLVK